MAQLGPLIDFLNDHTNAEVLQEVVGRAGADLKTIAWKKPHIDIVDVVKTLDRVGLLKTRRFWDQLAASCPSASRTVEKLRRPFSSYLLMRNTPSTALRSTTLVFKGSPGDGISSKEIERFIKEAAEEVGRPNLNPLHLRRVLTSNRLRLGDPEILAYVLRQIALRYWRESQPLRSRDLLRAAWLVPSYALNQIGDMPDDEDPLREFLDDEPWDVGGLFAYPLRSTSHGAATGSHGSAALLALQEQVRALRARGVLTDEVVVVDVEHLDHLERDQDPLGDIDGATDPWTLWQAALALIARRQDRATFLTRRISDLVDLTVAGDPGMLDQELYRDVDGRLLPGKLVNPAWSVRPIDADGPLAFELRFRFTDPKTRELRRTTIQLRELEFPEGTHRSTFLQHLLDRRPEDTALVMLDSINHLEEGSPTDKPVYIQHAPSIAEETIGFEASSNRHYSPPQRGSRRILWFEIEQRVRSDVGSGLIVVGPQCSGKTTTLRKFACEWRPAPGQRLVRYVDIGNLKRMASDEDFWRALVTSVPGARPDEGEEIEPGEVREIKALAREGRLALLIDDLWRFGVEHVYKQTPVQHLMRIVLELVEIGNVVVLTTRPSITVDDRIAALESHLAALQSVTNDRPMAPGMAAQVARVLLWMGAQRDMRLGGVPWNTFGKNPHEARESLERWLGPFWSAAAVLPWGEPDFAQMAALVLRTLKRQAKDGPTEDAIASELSRTQLSILYNLDEDKPGPWIIPPLFAQALCKLLANDWTGGRNLLKSVFAYSETTAQEPVQPEVIKLFAQLAAIAAYRVSPDIVEEMIHKNPSDTEKPKEWVRWLARVAGLVTLLAIVQREDGTWSLDESRIPALLSELMKDHPGPWFWKDLRVISGMPDDTAEASLFKWMLAGWLLDEKWVVFAPGLRQLMHAYGRLLVLEREVDLPLELAEWVNLSPPPGVKEIVLPQIASIPDLATLQGGLSRGTAILLRALEKEDSIEVSRADLQGLILPRYEPRRRIRLRSSSGGGRWVDAVAFGADLALEGGPWHLDGRFEDCTIECQADLLTLSRADLRNVSLRLSPEGRAVVRASNVSLKEFDGKTLEVDDDCRFDPNTLILFRRKKNLEGEGAWRFRLPWRMYGDAFGWFCDRKERAIFRELRAMGLSAEADALEGTDVVRRKNAIASIARVVLNAPMVPYDPDAAKAKAIFYAITAAGLTSGVGLQDAEPTFVPLREVSGA